MLNSFPPESSRNYVAGLRPGGVEGPLPSIPFPQPFRRGEGDKVSCWAGTDAFDVRPSPKTRHGRL